MEVERNLRRTQLLAEKRLLEELEPIPPPVVGRRYSVKAALRYLGKSRTSLHYDVQAGRLRVIREGRRVFIPGEEILRLTSVAAVSRPDRAS